MVSIGPRMATTAARTSRATPAPSSGEHQPRLMPEASTMVIASTISAALAVATARIKKKALTAAPILRSRFRRRLAAQ